LTNLDEEVDFVVGVDTHKNSHTAAVVTATGGALGHLDVPTDAFGAKHLLAFASETARGRRVWAIEGTGSYGAGLTSFLLEHGEWVVERDRPARAARRNGEKSDEIDAVRAAREALSRKHLAQPRRRGEREAMRVLVTTRQGAMTARTRAICHLKSLVVNSPEGIRNQLRRLTTDDLLDRCARLRTAPSQTPEHRATIAALRSTARRALALEAEAADLESQLEVLVKAAAPWILEEPGIGTISAAQILCSWSHPGRLRSEAAFARLAGVAPIEASSGVVKRHRLNRAGDRQLNRALHTVVLSRLTYHGETKAYSAKRIAEGKSSKEIKRCLKRHLARRLFKRLESDPSLALAGTGASDQICA
jgi:transposase